MTTMTNTCASGYLAQPLVPDSASTPVLRKGALEVSGPLSYWAKGLNTQDSRNSDVVSTVNKPFTLVFFFLR